MKEYFVNVGIELPLTNQTQESAFLELLSLRKKIFVEIQTNLSQLPGATQLIPMCAGRPVVSRSVLMARKHISLLYLL